MQRVLVLLVVLVALAGCNGVFDGGSDAETFTPVAVPTDEPTPTPVPQFAPGLTGKGVENASALAAAHDALLENTSFTAREVVTYRTRNGTLVRRVTSVTRIGENGRFRAMKRWNGTSTLRRVAYYYDGERLFVTTTDTRGTTYRRASPKTVALRHSVAGTDSERIERLFMLAETRIAERTEQNGTTVYRLVPEAIRRNRSATTADDRSVSVYARVTARGLVRSYTFRQTLSSEGSDGATVIVVSTNYTEIDSTTVEQPVWYGAAVAQTNTTASNRTETPV